MADTKISALPSTTAATDADLIPAVQGGATKRLTVAQVAARAIANGAAAASDLTAHEALTTAAHGGIVADDDSRLSDARTPTAHTHSTAFTTAITLSGDARVWDDLRIEPTVRAAAGAGVPAFEKWLDNGAGSVGVDVFSFTNATAGQEKEIYFTLQMPHSWDGTAIYLHCHWLPATSEAAAAVRWGLEYTWAGIGAEFGVTTLAYGVTPTPADADLTQYRHYLTAVATLTPSGAQAGASSILIGRLFRDSANAADTYTGKAGLLYIDCHYRLSRLGEASLS